MRHLRLCWMLAALVVLLAHGPALARQPARPTGLKRVLFMSDAEKNKLPASVKQQAVAKFGLRAVALSNDFVARHSPTYACVIPGENQPHRIRDQKGSGRCWIYATDRVLRSLTKTRGVKAPEMSTSFVNYYALRDQALGVLRKAAAGDRKGLAPDLAVDAASEGGFQPWALDIIREHGFVPKRRMDSTADAFNSAVAVNELQRLVVAAQGEFRKVKKSAPDAAGRRQSILQRYEGEVNALLSATLGAPPTNFKFRGKSYTPQSFVSDYLRLGPSDLDFVVLTNKPTRRFMVQREVKSTGMQPFAEYNVSMPVLKRAVKDTIRQGQAVYVATNVSSNNPYRADGKKVPAAKGILSLAAFNYDSLIPQHRVSKHDRLKAGISTANHAMAITGFDSTGKGKVGKWLVENSWGPRAGDAGHWHMYDDFFRQYVESVAVPRSVVPKGILERCDARAKTSKK
jgi:bleomycin hydrolase